MNSHRLSTPYTLLDWVIQRGRHLLAVRVSRAGELYEISVCSPGRKGRLHAEFCRGGATALRLHAALVAGFRDAGWRSVAYR